MTTDPAALRPSIGSAASKSSDGVLFETRLTGGEAVETLRKARLFRRLFSLSHKHVADKRRQLVVFSFDYIGHRINLDGVFEKGELDTFFGWLGGHANVCDGTAIDVGANIGNHSLYFSDHYPKVISFEPNPRTFKVLELNAALVANVTCFECGLSDAAGEARLNLYANNVGHSDVGTAATGASSVAVRLQTLDAALDPGEVVRLIKYDVEGHEYQAIQGSRATIARERPVILFEQLAKEFVDGSSPVIELLRSYGYRTFACVSASTTRLRSANGVVDGLLALVNRLPIGKSLMFGTTWSLRVQQRFKTGDYPFIAAIPDWIGPTRE